MRTLLTPPETSKARPTRSPKPKRTQATFGDERLAKKGVYFHPAS